jgi:hypothetical protein
MTTLMLKTSVLLIAALTAAPALAQPTPAQTDAIKSNCRSDYMKSCMSVPPGGQAAFDCLKRNVASLSPACQGAVNAIKPPAPAAAAPAPVPAAAPAPAPAASAPAAVTPPPPAAAATVAHAPAAAPVAAPAPVVASVAAAPTVRAAPAPKPVAAAPAAAAVAAAPTAAQQNAIRHSCRNDFMANCSGVQPGGKEALVCLQTHAARLSPACRTAVSAIGSAPKPAATAVAVAPAMPTAEQQAAIKNTCRADFMRNCRGVQPGGPEALICLQNNSARLSPNCKTSVAAIADSVPPASAAAATTAAPVAAAAPAKRQYLTPGIHPAVRVGRRIRERLEENR